MVPGAVTVPRRYGLDNPTFVNPILPLGAVGVPYAFITKSLPAHEVGIFETVTDFNKYVVPSKIFVGFIESWLLPEQAVVAKSPWPNSVTPELFKEIFAAKVFPAVPRIATTATKKRALLILGSFGSISSTGSS